MSIHQLTLDQIGKVARGRSRHRPRDAAFLYGGSFPFIQTGDVRKANLYLTEFEQTYSDAGLAQSKLWPAGTLCITIAANIAETAILGIDACFPDSVMGFIADPVKADTRFVKYLFDGVLKTKYRSFTQGAAQDNLSQEKLLSIKFPVPEPRVQRRIADILSAYDDLIENNRRRVALLDDATRLLYREWFVHFRYPGHEHLKIVGGLPEGWGYRNVGQLCTFLGRGISPMYDDEGAYVVVSQKCVRGRLLSLAPARRQTRAFVAEKALQYLDVLINSTGTGTLGRVAQCWFKPSATTFDSHVTIARPSKACDPLWFGYALMELSSIFEGMGEGATNQKELSKYRIADVRVITPPRSLQKLFADVAGNTTAQIQTLLSTSEQLAQARDLLLPRLMSGALAV